MSVYYDKYIKYKTKYFKIKYGTIFKGLKGAEYFESDKDSDDFPYKKRYMLNDELVKTKFNNLKKYTANIVYDQEYSVKNLDNEPDFFTGDMIKYNGRYTLIINDYSDYEKYNIISDYFNEECRMKCKRYDADLSPFDYWITNRDKVQKHAQNKYKKTDAHSLRESIYELSNECTSFRPTLIVAIIKLFNAKKVLDFSAGWGDRLIGAISQDVEYFGVDPNPCLHPNYQKIIKMFVTDDNKHKYTLVESGFETINLPENRTYDLIFTSPPYFTLEQYVPTNSSGEENQSITKFNDMDTWLNGFLYVCIDKGWEKLETSGHLVIVINNIRDHPNFIKKMIMRMSDKYKGNIKYLGLISYAERNKFGFKSPQPMWIWQKI